MRALVVYESMYGNTAQLAEAIGAALSAAYDVQVAEVGSAPGVLGDDLDLLVVGGPTHAFGMSRPATRTSAAKESARPLVSGGIGQREWLAGLRLERGGHVACAAAAFDTRVGKSWVPGSAARAAEGRLRKRGFRIVAPAESFWVVGTTGPLRDGELDRARAWGTRMATDSVAGNRRRSWPEEPGHPVL